jgi:ribosomal protein S18 acetylase RimI-like enzyme
LTAWAIRGFRPTDARRLTEINPTFVSPATLRVHKTGAGFQVGWRLEEEALAEPYDKGAAYDLDARDVEEISERAEREDCLVLVAEAGGRLIGLCDLEITEWNNTGWLWNLLVDLGWRGQGLGRALFVRGLAWARQRNLRAIFIETQTNNVPACRFYHHMGCHLVSVHDEYYTNHDIDAGEVAVLWTYTLSDTAPDAFTERD